MNRFHPPIEASAQAEFWGKPQTRTEDMRFSDAARGLLDIRSWRMMHECCREAFDPLPRRGFFVRPPPRTAGTPTVAVPARNPGAPRTRTSRDGIHEKSGLARARPIDKKGAAAMTQATIVLGFLVGLVGIMLWIIGVIALDILHDVHRAHDQRQKTAAPEEHEYDGYEPHDAHHVSQRL